MEQKSHTWIDSSSLNQESIGETRRSFTKSVPRTGCIDLEMLLYMAEVLMSNSSQTRLWSYNTMIVITSPPI